MASRPGSAKKAVLVTTGVADEPTTRHAQAVRAGDLPSSTETVEALPTSPVRKLPAWLAALDRLPPIRLPIGPAIPWRYGLPSLLALVVVMAVVSRPAPKAQSAGFRLPADETYAVTEESPLFTNTRAQATPAPIGVSDPPGLGVDILDLTLKLVAVLALAYGSLALLKKTGLGGAGGSLSHTAGESLRVLSTLPLAPNRSVHVVRVPGGKTLLLGATPAQVNLIADLGQLSEDELVSPGSGLPSFFDVLTSKLPHTSS